MEPAREPVGYAWNTLQQWTGIWAVADCHTEPTAILDCTRLGLLNKYLTYHDLVPNTLLALGETPLLSGTVTQNADFDDQAQTWRSYCRLMMLTEKNMPGGVLYNA